MLDTFFMVYLPQNVLIFKISARSPLLHFNRSAQPINRQWIQVTLLVHQSPFQDDDLTARRSLPRCSRRLRVRGEGMLAIGGGTHMDMVTLRSWVPAL